LCAPYENTLEIDYTRYQPKEQQRGYDHGQCGFKATETILLYWFLFSHFKTPYVKIISEEKSLQSLKRGKC
jgi:hypothetical protein